MVRAGQTERVIEAILGPAIRAIGGKVIDTTTEESILKEDNNTYDFWCHPRYAHILETTHDLLDSGEHDALTYKARMAQDWNTTIRKTTMIDSYAAASNETATAIITANTKENFFVVNIAGEPDTWMAWKEIDDGETIEYVKRYKGAHGYIARSYLSGTQAYKAMFVDLSTPNGA